MTDEELDDHVWGCIYVVATTWLIATIFLGPLLALVPSVGMYLYLDRTVPS